MNWRLKALVQKAVAALPGSLSNRAYYLLQRRFGRIGADYLSACMKTFAEGVKLARHVLTQGMPLEGAKFLEVGTWRNLNLPISLWLAGASAVTSVDKNRYLKEDLVLGNLASIVDSQDDVAQLFGELADQSAFRDRMAALLSVDPNDFAGLVELIELDYSAPSDAARLELPADSVDCHVSRRVMEHIPPNVVHDILAEATRVLKPGGLCIHLVDFSDHFAHTDNSISSINFLRYDDRRWARWAGNRYAYHNRLRVDDFSELFSDAGLEVLSADGAVCRRALEELEAGFPLDVRFAAKSNQVNATAEAWIVARRHP